MRSPLPQRKGLTSTEHVRRPAVYVQDASCVRPFRSEYSIAANAKSSVWQNIMSKGQYIGQWISPRQNSIDEFPMKALGSIVSLPVFCWLQHTFFRENCQLNCKNDAIFVESDAKTKSLVLLYNKVPDAVVAERGDDIHKRVL